MTDLTLAPSHIDHWPEAPGWMPLTIAGVDRVVRVADVRVRNLWITQSYADLARRMLAVLDGNQSWCSFAIWASNTAGVSIRGDELPTFATRLLAGDSAHADALVAAANRSGVHRLIGARLEHGHIRPLVERAIGQVSEHIAHGNTLVYAELAPIFVRFLERIEHDDRPGAADVDTFLDGIGVPAATEEPLVRQAFRHYALAAANEGDTAEHVLTANVAAVLHEQQRLQHDIAAALDAGLVDVADAVDGIGRSWFPSVVRRLLGRFVARRVAQHVEHLWAEVATHLLMTLDVPGQTLRLARDVPPAPGADHLFPGDLAPLELPELVTLMQLWDVTGGTGIGSGADDWADLHDRMGYIVNLFRSRQQTLSLTTPPFSADEIATMRRQQVPSTI